MVGTCSKRLIANRTDILYAPPVVEDHREDKYRAGTDSSDFDSPNGVPVDWFVNGIYIGSVEMIYCVCPAPLLLISRWP